MFQCQSRHPRQKIRGNGIAFIHNEQEDCYICLNNKKLRLVRKGEKKNGKLQDRYQCKDCRGCTKRRKCTKSKIGRTIYINPDHQWISSYRAWISQPENREQVKKRKTIVEHPFGTMKMIMGNFCFLLRKLPKVQVEIAIYATVYNLKRLINIERMNYLLEAVENHNWKVA